MHYKDLFMESGDNGSSTVDACKIKVLLLNNFENWLSQQDELIKKQLQSRAFKPESGASILLLDQSGERKLVLFLLDNAEHFLLLGGLAAKLPAGSYFFDEEGWPPAELGRFVLSWGLGGYYFDYYLTENSSKQHPFLEDRRAQLVMPESIDKNRVHALLASSFWVRDLINMPADRLYPDALAKEAEDLANEFGAKLRVTQGEELEREFPAVAMVGRGSERKPCLIDLRYGQAGDFKLTLVGKGVCFDAGGLDLKSSAGMLQMKKDMAGAAHALGIARIIMSLGLPICLRVIVPAVENLPSGSAMKVRDIIRTRSGITVEVGNTDAEGRLILADALALAAEDKPDLLIDFATLTGAARVALGMDMAALFGSEDRFADRLVFHMQKADEPVWRMPLYQPYLKYLRTSLADLNNTTADTGISGGAITAALFLQQFTKNLPWIHLDFNGDNIKESAGRPKGGEAICLRGMLNFLEEILEGSSN